MKNFLFLTFFAAFFTGGFAQDVSDTLVVKKNKTENGLASIPMKGKPVKNYGLQVSSDTSSTKKMESGKSNTEFDKEKSFYLKTKISGK